MLKYTVISIRSKQGFTCGSLHVHSHSEPNITLPSCVHKLAQLADLITLTILNVLGLRFTKADPWISTHPEQFSRRQYYTLFGDGFILLLWLVFLAVLKNILYILLRQEWRFVYSLSLCVLCHCPPPGVVDCTKSWLLIEYRCFSAQVMSYYKNWHEHLHVVPLRRRAMLK